MCILHIVFCTVCKYVLSIRKLLLFFCTVCPYVNCLLFFCTVCPYVNCLLFFCTVWSTLIRISLTKALVLWWCDNKSDLIWFYLIYVAAIAARRELDEIPLGRHRMVSAFMRGARRLRPVRPTAVPSWDLSVVLEGLVTAPFEPLESASDRILTLKVVLLLALTSLKRVGDLQAFSVSETCMDFAPGLVKVTLRPRPGYIPKVLSTSFRSQVVTLHSFHPPPFASSEDERLHLLCPVRALKLYVDRSKVWRKSPQLLICFGAGRRGLATSKQRISHWVRDAISLAYEARNLPSPLSLRAHSTRGVASSQALFRGVPLEDICVAAGWSSPHTFVRFYNLDVDTAPGSQVLSVWTDRMLLVHYWAR